METINTWDVLNDAATIIERDGHVKGKLHGGGGGHCALGALCEATYGVCRQYGPARMALAKHLDPRGLASSIAEWNDAPERTAAEVVATLRTVAALEKARAGGAAVKAPPVVAVAEVEPVAI